MSFLSPLFLLAAGAVVVPLALHLFHRHEPQRVVFPALRYLLRTERDHARRIRLRQLLLLFLRCALVVLLVLAGARLVVAGRGEAHPPTAVVVILDNSMSSGRVLGDDRVLDRLKSAALQGLDAAGAEDRIWVIRAGEPWDLAVPGPRDAARARIAATEVSAARGDLSLALRRARQLIDDAGMAAGEIHLVSDLQATAFDATPALDDPDLPVLVWSGLPAATTNRYLLEVTLGGGLPPLAHRRTEVSVGLAGGDPEAGETAVRLFIDDRVRGAAAVRSGSAAVLPVGPFGPGWVEGYVEADPDALRDDDRRWFAVPVRNPPTVALGADGGLFLTSALAVLYEAGRALPGTPATAEVLLAPAGTRLDGASRARQVLLAPSDPALLPAINLRLADAGIAWRYRADAAGGEARIVESRVPVDLEGVRVRQRYLLEAPPGSPGSVLARLSDGTPWLVTVDGAQAPLLLIGSPLDDAASTLPVDAAMVPLLEWIVTGWGAGTVRPTGRVGEALPLPTAATEVELPDGSRVEVDGSFELRTTRAPGVYRVFAGDSLVELLAVNPPVRESILDPLDVARFAQRLGPATLIDDPVRWPRETFTRRQGYETWRALLMLVLALLLLESWIAASGGQGTRPGRAPLATPS